MKSKQKRDLDEWDGGRREGEMNGGMGGAMEPRNLSLYKNPITDAFLLSIEMYREIHRGRHPGAVLVLADGGAPGGRSQN